jgi:hypothetical protein
MLQEISGQWAVDENGNLTYQRIVEVPGIKKDEIFTRAQNYFVYNYGSGKSVIQNQDKEAGLLLAKGLFDDVHMGDLFFSQIYIGTWHIVRVDVKEGRARILLTLSEYDTRTKTPDYTTTATVKVVGEFPVNPKGTNKTVYGKAFYRSHKMALSTIDAIDKAIKEGNTSKTIENADW